MNTTVVLGSDLTPRELQVLRLVADGMTDGQIGRQLFISADTVGSHMYRIRIRLGESSRAAVVRAAFERGVLRIPAEELVRQARELDQRMREQRLAKVRGDLARQAASPGRAA